MFGIYSVYTFVPLAENRTGQLFDRSKNPVLKDGVTQLEAEEAVRDQNSITTEDSNGTKLCIGSTEAGKVLWVAYERLNPSVRQWCILLAQKANAPEMEAYFHKLIQSWNTEEEEEEL